MKWKLKKPGHSEVESLLVAVHTQSVQDVTRVLRELERAYETYPTFQPEDAEAAGIAGGRSAGGRICPGNIFVDGLHALETSLVRQWGDHSLNQRIPR